MALTKSQLRARYAGDMKRLSDILIPAAGIAAYAHLMIIPWGRKVAAGIAALIS